MIVGIPKEIKEHEYRAGILPVGVEELSRAGHRILVQKGLGLAKADLVVGAVLIRGARTPRLVRLEDLKLMKPGAVVVAVDQGGCFETTHATTHSDPTYLVDDVVHYAVANMPGAVGRTSTYALCNATLPYVLHLANLGLGEAVKHQPDLVSAINLHRGQVTNLAVADTFGLSYMPFRPDVAHGSN
jgi:alanine dehydrogenase